MEGKVSGTFMVYWPYFDEILYRPTLSTTVKAGTKKSILRFTIIAKFSTNVKM